MAAANWPIPLTLVSRTTATRVTLGATLHRSSSHFSADAVFEHCEASGIAARSRQAIDETSTNRIDYNGEHNRHAAGDLLQSHYAPGCQREATITSDATNSVAYLR